MLLRPDELDAHLRDRLAPVYWLAGEEPLFVQEGLDAVRAAARAAGFVEREVLDAGSGFDWGELDAVAGAMSLFGDRKVVELRMPTGKDRKSTRLNSSHVAISYAVFCWKKKQQ